MSQYHRRYQSGSTYFFTACLAEGSNLSLVDHADLLRQSLRVTKKQMPFDILSGVILPDKVHMIWQLPDDDCDFSKRWRMIKSTFSRHVPMPVGRTQTQIRRREKGVWQRRFWEHLITDADDFAVHDHLIATAPVVARLVAKASQWPLSSAGRPNRGSCRVRLGAPPPDVRTTVPVP